MWHGLHNQTMNLCRPNLITILRIDAPGYRGEIRMSRKAVKLKTKKIAIATRQCWNNGHGCECWSMRNIRQYLAV
jgi:hypothetical protein